MLPTITEGLEDPASMQVALNRPIAIHSLLLPQFFSFIQQSFMC